MADGYATFTGCSSVAHPRGEKVEKHFSDHLKVTMRLLLVEPDALLAERLQESLESEGYDVDLVETLSEARHTVNAIDYAAVLMDLHLNSTVDEASSLDVDIWFG
jgi:ActR/RegA family two-component response regulator